MTCTRSIASRTRSLTELFRFFPTTDDGLDIFLWMRAAALDARLDPGRCALVTVDSAVWRDEVATDGDVVPILRKRGVILSDDGRAFSFTIVTNGRGASAPWVERLSGWKELDENERSELVDGLAEGERLLHGEVYFPPALFDIAYPPRDRALPWGASLSATVRDRIERTAFRRDGTIETSPLPEMSLSEQGIPRRVPEWIEDPYAFASEQASREEPLAQFRCPCCGYLTLMERAAYEICPVCCWEDDGQDNPHADEYWGGPNGSLTLSQARENFSALGAKEPQHRPHVRPPARPEH